VHIFQVDERRVPPDDPRSNYRLAHADLITPAGIPPANVHRVLGELPLEAATHRYIDDVQSFFGTAPGTVPVFDVVHRGMGGESHTASLFPGEPLISDTTGIAAGVHVPAEPPERVTLLPGPLTAARHTLMLVAGGDKADAMQKVFGRDYEPFHYPAQLGTWENPNAQWFVDSAAASLLTR
jgi:6-phosphogluconolactonase